MQIEGFEAQTNEAKWDTITIRKHRINSKQNQNLRIILSIHSYVVMKKHAHHTMIQASSNDALLMMVLLLIPGRPLSSLGLH